MRKIQIGKMDSISRRYQIIIINMLKNRSSSYSSHHIIKFVGFMPILYAINLYIVSSSIVLTICIFDLLIYSMFESILLFVISKKKKLRIL